MKKILHLFIVFIITLPVFGQDIQKELAEDQLEKRNEVYLKFTLEKAPTAEKLEYISRIISIDKIQEQDVWAYANHQTFNHFLELDLPYEVLTAPSMLHQPRMMDSREALSLDEWDYYPTYSAYVDIMKAFENNYPTLCEVVSIKTLNSSREILFIHINNDLGSDQNEPEFLYTSSMHGDELTGYVLSLRLIDYLLSNYGNDAQAKLLVDNIDIWINPLANPDGTFAGGNNTVFGATRGNAKGIDINRNFPDPEDGTNPDGNAHQEETVAFMDFADDHDFVMSANIHGGSEVANYPWDTWSKLHADDDWWIYVCRQYADVVHANSSGGYFTDLDNGITNGYEWYSISGGRQDYMNYFHNCREFTLEISSQKTPPASELEDFWEANYRSLLKYIEQVLYGVKGVVTDSKTTETIPAKVFVENHDKDNSEVYAGLPLGNYNRPIKSGTYDYTFSADGYYSKTINNVTATDEQATILNVTLDPIQMPDADFYANDTIVGIDMPINFFDTSEGEDITVWLWEFEAGNPATSADKNPTGIYYSEPGLYDVKLTIKSENGDEDTQLKEDYIRVSDIYTMVDTTIWLCEGIFYDSGGEDEFYKNDEDITMTFISLLESGSLKVTFRDFELEESDDCNHDYLEAFDGTDTTAPLLGKWCGNDSPGWIVASNISGAITFRFHSNSTINREGWKAEITCDTSLGLDSPELEAVLIYPNPASDHIRIEFNTHAEWVTINSITGHELARFSSVRDFLTVDIGKYPPGLYIVQAKTEGRVFIQKFIKQ